MRTVSLKSRTHSLVTRMNRQQRKKQQAPDVPNNSRTVHVVLSNNCSTLHWVRQKLTQFTMCRPKKHTSTPSSLQFLHFHRCIATSLVLAQQAVVRDLWSPPVVRHSLPHPSVRIEHTPIDMTYTLFVLPISGARLHLGAGLRLLTPHAVSAHGHTPNQHHFCDCSSCSIIHRECGDRVSRFHHSSRRAVHPLGPVPIHNHFITRTVCSCQSTDEAQAAPLCSCAPRHSKLTGHSNNSKLAHAAWHRLSFCGEGELVAGVHTLVLRSVQVYHELQVVEEGEKEREEVQEIERESQGEENAQMTMHMWMR